MQGLTITETTNRIAAIVEAALPGIPVFGRNRKAPKQTSGIWALLTYPASSFSMGREYGKGNLVQRERTVTVQLFSNKGVSNESLEALAQQLVDVVELYIDPTGECGFHDVSYHEVGEDPHGKYQYNVDLYFWYWHGAL